MKKNQIIRIVAQTLLVMVTVFIMLEFYQYNAIPYAVKWATTIALIVLNCVFSHYCGLKSGIEMANGYEKCAEELKAEAFNKIVDMVVEEKTNAER